MSKKVKPVRDLKNFIDAVAPSDEIIKKIKDDIEITLNEECIESLREACKRYYGDKDVINKKPRSTQIKAALDEIKAKAADLNNCLENIDFVTDSKLVGRFKPGRYDMMNILSSLIRACECSLASLSVDKGGPSRNYALDEFIRNLAEIYIKATGKIPTISHKDKEGKRYSGKFYSLIETVINIVDPSEKPTNDGLGRRIKTIIREFKNSSSL